VVVIGAVEEEIATSKGAYFVRDRFTPDACIIGEPSGADRITLGYKGRLLVDYTLHRPVVHSSRPEPTVGALGAAFWQAVQAWTDQQNAGYDRFFDQIIPGLRSINTSTDHFHDTVQLTVGLRLPPRLTPDQVLTVLSGLDGDDSSTLRGYSMEYAYLGDKRNGLVRSLLAAIRAQGSQPGFVLKGGTSDMNVVGMAWTCPIVAYGPGDSALDHTPDEHLPLEEYAQAVATLRHVIENLAISH
jgi:LysW-gamma-L-lysine carboxypeptidase